MVKKHKDKLSISKVMLNKEAIRFDFGPKCPLTIASLNLDPDSAQVKRLVIAHKSICK